MSECVHFELFATDTNIGTFYIMTNFVYNFIFNLFLIT